MSHIVHSQARAALHALFEPPPALCLAPTPPEPEPPTNLDEAVLADTGISWEHAVYRWYRGVDTHGVLLVFRFQRGAPLAEWHAKLRAQRVLSVTGPFRAQLQATAGS